MPCADDEHLFWPSAVGEAHAVVARGGVGQRFYGCALCHVGVDIVTPLLERTDDVGDGGPGEPPATR